MSDLFPIIPRHCAIHGNVPVNKSRDYKHSYYPHANISIWRYDYISRQWLISLQLEFVQLVIIYKCLYCWNPLMRKLDICKKGVKTLNIGIYETPLGLLGAFYLWLYDLAVIINNPVGYINRHWKRLFSLISERKNKNIWNI